MMMGLLAFALQLQLTAPPTARAAVLPQRPVPAAAPDEDSLRDVARAHDAQAGFERGRRYVLPWTPGSGGYCDVRVGRFCWWYGGNTDQRPSEPEEVRRRREELLGELDALGHRRPADPWIAGMRVYYRVDNRQPALADSAARECAASAWWCTALRAYAAQARNDVVAADSGFAAALESMPDSTRCTWRDISVLLPAGARERYERLGCAERQASEARYWLLARPRLAVPANEWRSEFYARRVAATLLADAVTPHRISWGKDTEELLLRYGLPVAWSRIPPTGMTTLEPDILGHEPAPSFHYGPTEEVLERDNARGELPLRLNELKAESRYAHPAIRRLADVRAAIAAFRRGDSTLVAAAWETSDDSLAHPAVALGALLPDGRSRSVAADSAARGHALVMVPGRPVVAGVELADSATGTFALARTLLSARPDSTSITLSDLLLFRPAREAVPRLDSALALAIPAATASLSAPLGLYWESYGADSAGTEVETSIFVERIEKGLFMGVRQRLGLADPDSPLTVRWSESGPRSGGVTPHALSLDLSRLPAGRYRITVGVTPAFGMGATSAREVELRDRPE